MLRLKRHIVTEILEVFLAVTIALLLILVSFQFAKLLGQAAEGRIAGFAIYQLVALQAVKLFVVLAPFAFFIAVLIVLSRLATTNELIAMRSVGFSVSKIYQTLFLLALPLAFGILMVSFYIIPKVIGLNHDLMQKARKESEMSIIQPGDFRTIGKNTTVYAIDIDASGFSGFFVKQRQKKGDVLVVAEQGKIYEKDADRYIQLENGSRYHEGKDKTSQLMFFKTLDVLLPATNAQSRGERLEAMPTHQLFMDKRLAAKAEFQRRTSPALSLLVLALLAPMLVHFNPRERRSGTFIIAILAYAIYANSQHVVQSLIEAQKFPIIPGIYITHILFLLGFLVWRFSHLNFKQVLHKRKTHA